MSEKTLRLLCQNFVLAVVIFFALITFLACYDALFPPVQVYGAEISDQELCEDLVKEINELRTQNGVSPLTVDSRLVSIASRRSKEATEDFSHYYPDGSMGVDLIPGNIWKGENLSFICSPATEREAVDTMMADLKGSPTHKENMVFADFAKIGVAAYTTEGGKITVAYMFSS